MRENMFWSKVNRDGPVPVCRPELGPCHVWIGRLSRLGYGVFGRGYGGKFSVSPHRRLWEETYGKLPRDIELDHLCRNRACVRLEHLEPVSHAENVRRGLKGELHAPRSHCGKGHPLAGPNYCRECCRLRRRVQRGTTQEAPAQRTHCPKGHPYDTRGGHGERACSVCLKTQKREWYLRNRDAILGRHPQSGP